MLNVDPVKLTEAYPRSTLIARRFRAALTGKIYYFNGQKNRARVFHALNTEVQFENYVETGTFLGMTTDFLARTAGERGARVYSCEIDDRHFGIASRTVGMLQNVVRHALAGVEFRVPRCALERLSSPSG
jgi:predicted O-methyltransferase YrrM